MVRASLRRVVHSGSCWGRRDGTGRYGMGFRRGARRRPRRRARARSAARAGRPRGDRGR
ncbi:hypothetical protein N136_00963, partial [Leifsonia aquatica ATCC 14665]